MKKSRSALQEDLINLIYQIRLSLKFQIEFDLTKAVLDYFEEEDLHQIDPYLIKTLNTVLEFEDEVIGLIKPALKDWEFDRLTLLLQATLISIVTQVKKLELEKAIGINIAVKYAKQYLDQTNYKFVNAILDRIL